MENLRYHVAAIDRQQVSGMDPAPAFRHCAKHLFRQLYLDGLAQGDFKPALRGLLKLSWRRSHRLQLQPIAAERTTTREPP